MNEQLTERFGRSRSAFKLDKEQAAVWIVPQRLNERVREYFNEPQSPIQGGDWLRRPEIPSSEEILDEDTSSATASNEGSSDVVIVPNRKTGAWQSKEEYLAAHYELLREDALRPLRETVARVRMTPEASEDAFGGALGIYEKVHICGITCSTRGIAIRITFSLRRVGKFIRWEQSKRLITGGLVVLTPKDDMFTSKAIVAVVAARPLAGLEQNPPEIDIFIPRHEEQEIDPGVEWIMVEDRGGLFEAHRHTLLALQRMMKEPFPMSEHLVNLDCNIPPPEYIQLNPRRDMSSVFHANTQENYKNVNVLQRWPMLARSELDKSQLEALQRILTKRLATVQGPPGTGKTHVSVQAIKVMLANREKGDPPIIIACQTNHAVDQILRHIANFEADFVRLGGRSKDRDVIKSRTLYEVRKLNSENPVAGSLSGSARKRMKGLEKECKVLLSLLDAREKKPLDFRTVEALGLLTQAQANSLEAGALKWVRTQFDNPNEARSPFTVWMSRSLIPVAPKQLPEDFGFEFEEADLEMEQLKEIEAENSAKDEEDFETLSGEWIPVADHFTGKETPGITEAKAKEALKSQDFWKIPEAVRPAVYRHLQSETKKMLLCTFRDKTKIFNDQAKCRSIGHWEHDEIILRKQKIIGMTTTGFSKYRGLISALQPKVVLIEEAAEMLEAPVTVTCIPSLEHLILVGDHQQLRPHTHFKLHEDAPYYLNVSLFERLVRNNIEYTTLVMQRRMIPEIRRLLRPIYEDKIVDHPCVTNSDNRPNVPGMGGINSWFFSHQWPEQRDEQMSAYNPDEADMIVGFAEYLVFNGMETEDITVLTFYNGQRKEILGKLRQKVSLGQRRFNVVTVDSYQGEENEVVILSLVRSNDRGQIGFLNIDNRVCVALSRAKCGFYIFGNAYMLYAEYPPPPDEKKKKKKKPIKTYPTWAKVIDIMGDTNRKRPDRLKTKATGRLEEYLPVRCRNHSKDTSIVVPADWDLLYGGCSTNCTETLACGHACTLKCHPFAHENVQCREVCGRALACGHLCAEHCGEVCSCSVCGKPRPTKSSAEPCEDYMYEDTEEFLQSSSSSQASSAESWHSFAREEPIRCAEAGSPPASRRASPEKSGKSNELSAVDTDNMSAASARKPFGGSSKKLDGVGGKMKTLTLELDTMTTGPSGTSPLTAVPDQSVDITPTQPKAAHSKDWSREESLLD